MERSDGITMRVRRSVALRVRQVGVGVTLHDPTSSHMVVLDGTAAAIWGLIDGSRTADEIATALAARYGADREVVARDVTHTLAALLEHGVAELEEA